MTDQDILTAAIKKAKDNGWKTIMVSMRPEYGKMY